MTLRLALFVQAHNLGSLHVTEELNHLVFGEEQSFLMSGYFRPTVVDPLSLKRAEKLKLLHSALPPQRQTILALNTAPQVSPSAWGLTPKFLGLPSFRRRL